MYSFFTGTDRTHPLQTGKRTTTRRWSKSLFITVCLVHLVAVFPCFSLASADFPVYPAIRNNVTFWEQVYSRYSTNSAVIHDRKDLSKIYEVVSLRPDNGSESARYNKALLKKAEKKYSDALRKLARGGRAVTRAEKKVAGMYTGRNSRKRMARAAELIRSQTGQKERFLAGVVRSGRYMRRIQSIFLSHGLPAELCYLPHVESSFNPAAYSKFGAAGMWQFTRGTGKQYMQIGDAVDERKDPFIAADAAARYLKASYRKLGSWPLALTAYNYGTAGMLRAQKALGDYERIFSRYDEGHFGFASRNFYSEFLAALRVAKKIEANRAIKLDRGLDFIPFTLPGYISLSDVKRHFKLSAQEIARLNPALKKPVFSGRKMIPRGYELRLPRRADMQRLIAVVPGSRYSNRQKRDPVYRVVGGDTAGSIALKHKISLSRLIEANSLDRNATIYVGQHLKLPIITSTRPGQGKVSIAYLSAQARKQFSTGSAVAASLGPETSTLPVLAGSKKNLPAASISNHAAKRPARENLKKEHISVEPEESLALYASWLKTSEEKLRRANGIKPLGSIYPGQKITIAYEAVTAAEFAEQRAQYLHDNEADFFAVYQVTELKTYRVQRGDTLWDLCNTTFNIPLWLLRKYNRDLNYVKISTNQKLLIPVIQAR